jgi:acyl-coenzyme A synthetase/AMP-(fatty) acid ligase
MNMPSSRGACLASLICEAHHHGAVDFIGDDIEKATLLSLVETACVPESIRRLRGKAVLLAPQRQLCAVKAMIVLDGLVGRMILWPPDEALANLQTVQRACGADEVITTWPPADNGASTASTPDALGLAQGGNGALETEWVLFTSGSTGTPKPVVHTLRSLAGHLIGRPSPAGDPPVWCTFYDVRRYGGLQILLRALLAGGSLVLSAPSESPAAFLARAAAEGVTHILGTPSHWRSALLTPAHSLISPVYIRLSGETANQGILDQLRAAYPSAALVHAFASTEAGLGFEVSDGLAGFPASLLVDTPFGVELSVTNDTLHLRSVRTARRLLNQATEAVAGADGFVDTGDRVALQGDRYHFVGRRDGVINVGGQKVHPEEVEAVINLHPAVQMSRVGARRSPITGAIVVAEIVTRTDYKSPTQSTDGDSLERELKAFCRARLAPHKIPASVKRVLNLPISPSGKLLRTRA